MRTGRAAIYGKPNGPFIATEYPVRPARAGEALVRVSMSTICRSDIHHPRHLVPLTAGPC